MMRIRCVAPLNLREQVFDKVGLTTVKDALPKELKIENDSEVTIYLTTKMVDIFTKCDDGASAPSITGIPAKQSIDLLIDPTLSVCFNFSLKKEGVAKFDNRCRAHAGEKVIAPGADAACITP
jgi:hypothetical protein